MDKNNALDLFAKAESIPGDTHYKENNNISWNV